MNILNEPISTWISIAAFLISFFTLLLALRKQKYDEKNALAGKIAEIKALYGESARAIDELFEKYDGIEKLLRKPSRTNQESQISLDKSRSSLENIRVEVQNIYRSLGHGKIRTDDPFLLSAILVEGDDLKKRLEKENSFLDILVRDMGSEIMKSPRKLVKQKTPNRQKPKRNVSKKG